MAVPPQQPPPSANPDAAGDAAPQDQGSAPGGAQQLVEGIHTALMKLMDIVQKVSPESAQDLDEIVNEFQEFVQKLITGQQGPQPQEGPPGPTAGGPGAVPAA